MTVRFSGFLCAAAVGIAALCAALAFGQKQAFTPSKGWYNQPDLQGIWMPAKPIDNLEKGGFIKEPSNGKIPYVAGAKAKRDQNEKNAKTADLVNKCYMPGLPRLMTMGYPFQIFETEKYVSIVSEYSHTYRMIYLDGSPHLDFPGLWNGDARGKWDGDSTVTDVTNFNGDQKPGSTSQATITATSCTSRNDSRAPGRHRSFMKRRSAIRLRLRRIGRSRFP